MSLQNDNFNHRNTFDLDIEKKHKTNLGLETPEDYFSKSRQSIMDKTIHKEKTKVVSMYKNIAILSAVAVVALLFILAIYNPVSSDNEVMENDILIASVLTDDENVDELVENYINDELLTEDVFSE